jgi:anti-sigma B factor antagonist
MTVRQLGDATVVELKEREITDETLLWNLEKELLEVLEEHEASDLIIDFSEVHMLSSRMLGTLVRLLKRARETGGRVRLCSIQRRILHILELTRLNEVFEIFPDAESALSSD